MGNITKKALNFDPFDKILNLDIYVFAFTNHCVFSTMLFSDWTLTFLYFDY